MTDRELELRLKKAVEACTPDVLDKVMAECDNYKENIIPFKRKKNRFRQLSAVAAAVTVVLGLSAFGIANMDRVASVVSLEVNPSIELQINKKEEVIEAIPLNTDAEAILGEMELEGTDIYTATNAIIGSLLKHGYIDELANSILLSVEDKDSKRGESLQKMLADEINAILNGASVNAALLSQYVVEDSVDAVAKQYEISHGKAALIENILEANNTYSFEELAKLSVNELNLIISNSKNNVKDVATTGKVTDGAYIGEEKANQIAFSHAGVSEKNIRELEVEIDYEHHAMVYEVEFKSGEVDYEYYIDAMNGTILKSEKEHDD